MLLGREMFLYYGPDQGCNQCLACESKDATKVCTDQCSGLPYTGCSGYKTQADCNVNICKWVNTSSTCKFDRSKGGVCKANQADSYFSSTFSFDTNVNGLLLLSEIVIGSNWYDNTVAGVQSLGYGGLVFFIVFFYIANYQFLRIFVCIITNNYELKEEEKYIAQEILLDHKFHDISKRKVKSKEEQEFMEGNYERFSFNHFYEGLLRGAQISLREIEAAKEGEAMDYLQTEGEKKSLFSIFFSSKKKDEGFDESKLVDGIRRVDGIEEDSEDEEEDPNIVYYTPSMIVTRLSINKYGKLDGGADFDEAPSLFEIAISYVHKLAFSPIFIMLTFIIIIASVVTAMMSWTGHTDTEYLLSLLFLAFFVFEMAVKMIALGIGGYFKDGWCRLDFLLVVLQILDVIENSFHIVFKEGDPKSAILKGFRALRLARLIAVIRRLPATGTQIDSIVVGVDTIIQALGASMPAILTLVVSLALFMLIFAIIAMDQFAGMFYACDETGGGPTFDTPAFGALLNKTQCVGMSTRAPKAYADSTEWHDGITPSLFSFPAPRTWSTNSLTRNQFTFNDIGDSYYTLFNLLLRSNIGPTVQILASMTNRDQAPVELSSVPSVLYVIIFQILLGIFIGQVVIGVILSYLRIKSGIAFYTAEQLSWPATKKAIRSIPSVFGDTSDVKEPEDENAFVLVLKTIQYKCLLLLTHWKFTLFMDIIVLLSCATIATTHFGASRQHVEVTWYINLACLILFILEALIKIIGIGPIGYFRNPSTCFDFLITLVGVLELIVLPRYGLELGLGSLRQFRLIRIGNRSQVFVTMLQSIVASFPQFFAVVLLLAMLIFIFGAIGTTLFPGLRYGIANRPWSGTDNLVSTMVLLFTFSSGAGGPDPTTTWGDIVVDASIAAPFCTPFSWLPNGDVNSPMGWFSKAGGAQTAIADCGSKTIAIIFFFIFCFICNYIILPSFVASVINSYYEANLDKYSLISKEELLKYRKCWISLMDKTTGYLKVPDAQKDKFITLLMSLESENCSLGFSMDDKKKFDIAMKYIKDKKALEIKETAAILFSVREKCRPVTVIDRLLRQKALDLLMSRGGNKLPKRQKAIAGKLHASLGLPPSYFEAALSGKKTKVKKNNIIYSYNIFVMIDQLSNLDDEGKVLDPKAANTLKLLVEQNDEDLFTYFEEFVEASGEDLEEKDKRYYNLLAFADRAKEIASRSMQMEKKMELKDEGSDAEELGPGEDEDGEDRKTTALATDLKFATEVPQNAEDVDRGDILPTEQEVIDLTNWKACEECGEPVEIDWDVCPQCNAPVN
uniref:Ion transport domain-containing protein n=1 Tax=Hanusia phi TaxID=3032 RepID=A0A7S0F1Q4_9CRYP|mmetsp:Transcript_3549/g.8701  ORF Transcript_3549/g.8701 Transcript_3549/m.8701 type:complete len:1300 (+) Transcript_3549:2418-6317(+)